MNTEALTLVPQTLSFSFPFYPFPYPYRILSSTIYLLLHTLPSLPFPSSFYLVFFPPKPCRPDPSFISSSLLPSVPSLSLSSSTPHTPLLPHSLLSIFSNPPFPFPHFRIPPHPFSQSFRLSLPTPIRTLSLPSPTWPSTFTGITHRLPCRTRTPIGPGRAGRVN